MDISNPIDIKDPNINGLKNGAVAGPSLDPPLLIHPWLLMGRRRRRHLIDITPDQGLLPRGNIVARPTTGAAQKLPQESQQGGFVASKADQSSQSLPPSAQSVMDPTSMDQFFQFYQQFQQQYQQQYHPQQGQPPGGAQPTNYPAYNRSTGASIPAVPVPVLSGGGMLRTLPMDDSTVGNSPALVPAPTLPIAPPISPMKPSSPLPSVIASGEASGVNSRQNTQQSVSIVGGGPAAVQELEKSSGQTPLSLDSHQGCILCIQQAPNPAQQQPEVSLAAQLPPQQLLQQQQQQPQQQNQPMGANTSQPSIAASSGPLWEALSSHFHPQQQQQSQAPAPQSTAPSGEKALSSYLCSW